MTADDNTIRVYFNHFSDVQRSRYPKFPKLMCKHPQLSHFTDMFCPFLVIPHSHPFFLIYALANDNPNRITFVIKDTKMCVSLVNLSAKDKQKLSKLLSKGFGRSVY